jgi:zinc transporter ZupT
MEFVYYTIAGIVLYLGSDWILNRIELSRGKRFEHRTAVFFVIILVLAVVSFRIIEHLTSQ